MPMGAPIPRAGTEIHMEAGASADGVDPLVGADMDRQVIHPRIPDVVGWVKRTAAEHPGRYRAIP